MHSPYDEGYRSYWRGVPCPFHAQSDSYHYWWQGYHRAMREAVNKIKD